MLVFIDDSGDAGFKLDKGSTRFFVIAMVVFDDDLEAEKTAVAIKEFRRELGFPDKVEFKFNQSTKDVRSQFLETVKQFDFRVRCIVVDKRIIRSEELKNSRESFYSYIIKSALRHSNDTILDAKVRIDGSGDRVFRQKFLTYLRQQLNSQQRQIMKNCRLVNSKTDVLIQMADMIAGAIRRSYDADRTDSGTYKKIIEGKIQDEWQFK